MADVEKRDVDLVTGLLLARMSVAVPPATVREYVRQGFADFADARVTDYVPVLVEHRVRMQLRE